jgi:hypothetical protein
MTDPANEHPSVERILQGGTAMKASTKRKLIDVVLCILIFSQLVQWFQEFFSYVVMILVSLVYIVCYRIARKAAEPDFMFYFWMWVPTAISVIIPIVVGIISEKEEGVLSQLLSVLPVVSLLIPGIILIWLRSEMDG